MTAAPGRIFTQCPSKHCVTLVTRSEPFDMETQPRHAAAQVTLLESSFVFLPCLRQVPLVWGENSSSEQHSFGKLPNAAAAWCTQGEQQRAQQGKQHRAQQGKQQLIGVQQQWHAGAAAATRCKLRSARSRCEQVPSTSRSSNSGELQAAAAASGERQQQRRAALCKLANQA